MLPHYSAGKVRGIGLFADQRLSVAPDVPTVSESGGPAIQSSSWVMFLAPAGTPQEILLKLSQAVEEVVQSPEMKVRFTELGIIPVGSLPGETAKFLKDEINKWGSVIQTANVKAE